MSTHIATAFCCAGIWALFVLDRDLRARTSRALWIPVLWLLIAGSRAVSQWLQSESLSSTDQYLDGSPIDRNVFTALLALGIIVLLNRGPQVRAFLVSNGPLLLFFSYCLVSVLWSDYPMVAFKRWTKAIGDVVMVLIVLTDRDRPSAVKKLLATTGFLLIPLSVLFIKYYPDLGRGYLPWVWTPVYTGVTTGKNLLGMICLLTGIASFWRFIESLRAREHGRFWTRVLFAHGVILAMVVWLLVKANSMTSLASVLVGVSLMLATYNRVVARTPALVHVLVATSLMICASSLFVDFGAALVESVGRDPTLTGRTAIWDLVLQVPGNSLIGTGFESFWLGERLEYIWKTYWWHPNQAHNGYLELFLNLGWAGVILFAVVTVTGYRNVLRAFRQDPSVARLKLAYFVTALAYNLTESAFKSMNPVWIMFLMVILAIPTTVVKTKVVKEVASNKSPRSDLVNFR